MLVSTWGLLIFTVGFQVPIAFFDRLLCVTTKVRVKEVTVCDARSFSVVVSLYVAEKQYNLSGDIHIIVIVINLVYGSRASLGAAT